MRKVLFTAVLMGVLAAQGQGRLEELFATTSATSQTVITAETKVEEFVQPLLSSRAGDQKTLRIAFGKMHSVFLKRYEAYADFNEVFDSGTYDCLTATALFSHILDQLNFSYEIIETNYHIFLMVQTSKGEVLIETTDRFGGFITDKTNIQSRTGNYRSNILASNDSQKKFEYSFKLYQSISPKKLTGLMYFNQAVKAFNKHDWISCATLLETSYSFYESPRCTELGSLLLRTVMDNPSAEKSRERCVSHLKSLWMNRGESIAAY